MSASDSAGVRRRAGSMWPLLVIGLAPILAPFSLRAVNAVAGVAAQNRSYLPSFETRATRKAFRPQAIDNLRYADPEWVMIGDSMLGTRIHSTLLGELSGTGDRNVALLMHAASGPALWYLTFKNVVAASGVKPRVTFFFFRDDNLTDTLFRLRGMLGDALDEVAHEREPELDALVAARQRGPWSGLDRALDRLYLVDTTSAWLHPTIRRWYALWQYPDPAARLHFENLIEEDFNQNFRRDLAADIGDPTENLDFHRDLPTSVLPLLMDLSRTHGLPICFVRVQRRPHGTVPPSQSPALIRYVQDFRTWATANGAFFHDDTGDPEMGEDLYEDGDHVADSMRYTRIFRRRLDALFK